MRKSCGLLLCLILLQACSNPVQQRADAAKPEESIKPAVVEPEPIPLRDRIATLKRNSVAPPKAAEKLYTFAAKELPIDKALKLFGQAYKLNLVIDDEVQGAINVNFYDLPFDQAMAALLDSRGYYWERDGNLIHIKSTETRVFTIDYIRLVRSGSGSSQAQVNSGSSQESAGSGTDQQAGAMKIEQIDKVDFWQELEAQLKIMVSEKGRLVSNRLAGTIQVTDQHRRVEEIGKYISQLNRAIYRQVDIEVKIVEVALNDDFSLGIDWSRIVTPQGDGSTTDFNINSLINQPAGGIVPLPGVLQLIYTDVDDNGNRQLSGVLNALRQQGDVKIVSQPRIRTLNNQSALIKVGTDRTFFRKEQLTDTTSAGSQILSTDVPQVVTEGIVLSLTPQISFDGWITMDLSPVVTRVSSVSEVVDENGVVQSSAPNLDISQASSLVRARSGETIIIGGLIQSTNSETDRGVPGLKRIPGLGYLFKNRYKATQRRELVMFVTPRLIDDSATALSTDSLRGLGT